MLFAQASSNLRVQRQSRSFHRTTTETRAEPKSKLKTLYVGSVPVLVLKSPGAKMDWADLQEMQRRKAQGEQSGGKETPRRSAVPLDVAFSQVDDLTKELLAVHDGCAPLQCENVCVTCVRISSNKLSFLLSKRLNTYFLGNGDFVLFQR